MKPQMTRMVRSTKYHFGALALAGALALVIVAAVPACAQDGNLQLDPKHSVAHLFLGSDHDPEAMELSVAHVNGSMRLDTNDLSESVFDFTTYAEDGALAATDAQISFHSKRVYPAANGSLRVVGDLTLTRAERNVTANPTEDYSGPVYGPPACLQGHS